MSDTLTVALYGRVSSQRQAEELTIQSQVDALLERTRQDGLIVAEEHYFLDEGYSGSTLQRPALERLRDLVHCGGLDRVYVHSPDRMARNYAYQFILLDEFKKHDVEVVFLNHDSQNRSPEGEMLLQMQGIIAEYERAKILERTRRGRRYAAKQGKVSALAHAPYGYRYVSKRDGDGEARYDIVLDEASLVKEMFTWVGIEGLSLGDVIRRLADRGIPTATGKAKWDRATVHGILRRSTYTGAAKFPQTQLIPRKPGRRPKRGDPEIPRQEKVARATLPEEQESIRVPAIVSQELFDAVADRLEENRRRHREQKKGTEYLLSGLLVCRCCGSAFCGHRIPRRNRQGPYEYYHCLGRDGYRHGGEAICTNGSVNAEKLENSVWSDVCSLLKDPGRLHREFERRLEQPSNAPLDGLQLKTSIQQLKRRMGRLTDAYENGWIDKADFETRIQRVRERLIREQESLAKCERDHAGRDELRLFVGHFETFADQITDRLQELDFAAKRKLLRLLIHRIEVHVDEVRIVYKVQSHPFVHSPDSRGLLQHCLCCRVTASR